MSVSPILPIRYPQHFTEFELHAWLYVKLHHLGYDVRGNVSCTTGRARFDLVIFNEAQAPALIIEVKRNHKHRKASQDRLYYSFGVPIIFCEGTYSFRPTLQAVKRYVKPVPSEQRLNLHPTPFI